MSNALNKPAAAAALALEESMYSCAGDLTPFWEGCLPSVGGVCDCADCVVEQVEASYYHFYRYQFSRDGYVMSKQTALDCLNEDFDLDHLRDVEYWDWADARDARKVANDEAAADKARFLAG